LFGIFEKSAVNFLLLLSLSLSQLFELWGRERMQEFCFIIEGISIIGLQNEKLDKCISIVLGVLYFCFFMSQRGTVMLLTKTIKEEKIGSRCLARKPNYYEGNYEQ